MRGLLKLLAIAAAAWLAWDWLAARGVRLPELPRKSLSRDAGTAEQRGEPVREPGRGLNPFVTDTDHAAPPQRPAVPPIPGGGR